MCKVQPIADDVMQFVTVRFVTLHFLVERTNTVWLGRETGSSFLGRASSWLWTVSLIINVVNDFQFIERFHSRHININFQQKDEASALSANYLLISQSHSKFFHLHVNISISIIIAYQFTLQQQTHIVPHINKQSYILILWILMHLLVITVFAL